MYGVTYYDIWSCDKISQVLPPLFTSGGSKLISGIIAQKDGEPESKAKLLSTLLNCVF